jgi:DNA-binding LacI/PurR family transcriptional regulator
MSSIKDVARLAGVSTATVSLVLNDKGSISEDTRQRVMDVVGQLGYQRNVRARNLRDQQSRVIGYAQASIMTTYNPILEKFLYYFVRELEKEKRHLLLFTSQEDSSTEEYNDLIAGRYVDGFILSYTVTGDARFQFLYESGVPFVAFGRSLSPLDDVVHWVDVDGCAGITTATEHLIEQGHRKIGLVAWDINSASGQERYRGYTQALANFNIPYRADYVFRGMNTIESGYQGAEILMRTDDPPTALVCVSDIVAAGVLRWSAQQNIQFPVTGFDDDPIAEFMHPSLTSLRQPLEQVARSLVTMLINLIEGKENPIQSELIPPELVIRESSLIRNI